MRIARSVLASLSLFAVTSLHASAQTANPRVYTPEASSDFAPPVEIWLTSTSFSYGAPIRPYISTEPGAYVTVVRVTTDGELRVLYPRRPADQRAFRTSDLVNNRLLSTSTSAFNTYESSGTGFVFVIASYKRFDYGFYQSGGEWSSVRLANSGRYGDPFNIVSMFVDRTLGDADFSMDYVSYEVYASASRSRYASRYNYSSLDHYQYACLNAFGIQRDYYCRGYNSGYYGPIVVAGPYRPSPNLPREPRVKPLVPDPMVTGGPTSPQPVEGRIPTTAAGEAAALARRERMLRGATPRVEMRSGGEGQSRTEPRIERAPEIYRSIPRDEHNGRNHNGRNHNEPNRNGSSRNNGQNHNAWSPAPSRSRSHNHASKFEMIRRLSPCSVKRQDRLRLRPQKTTTTSAGMRSVFSEKEIAFRTGASSALR